MSIMFNWWTGCLFYVIVVESARLYRLTASAASVELFDLESYQPLVRQGLINVLLVVGMLSLESLLVVESRYGPMLPGAWITGMVFSWIVLMLPLRGIRRLAGLAKVGELQWCTTTLRQARDELKSGEEARRPLGEIVAYRSVIENTRNWPFENTTLLRFAIYLLIPLGSWLGGALVERGIDLVLSGDAL
ncbi:MAG: hypothetical protein QF515_00790 [Pseudomonadales bacterium]|jgi:hypothetical protein|nr:hypothetical protein [Pseudomonadales bacterium]MDP6825645.1 hypothetical protein [Pseudomonadales bacterium]|tara:strand:+ start:936 stop:1505 length:570 start_codon:yes stop_codon:yes gene_type:complete